MLVSDSQKRMLADLEAQNTIRSLLPLWAGYRLDTLQKGQFRFGLRRRKYKNPWKKGKRDSTKEEERARGHQKDSELHNFDPLSSGISR